MLEESVDFCMRTADRLFRVRKINPIELKVNVSSACTRHGNGYLKILWINMTTALLLGMSLSFEPVERGATGVMHRPTRVPGSPVLDARRVWGIVLVAMLASAVIALEKVRLRRHKPPPHLQKK